MRAWLEAHSFAAVLALAGMAALSMVMLLWADTRDDARHEMQDDAPKGGR